MRSRYPLTVHIFLLEANNLLLIRRFNTGFEDGNYSLVAGHIDGEETVHQAAVREIAEEGGATVRPENLSVVGVMQRKSDDIRVDFFLVTRIWEGRPSNHEPDKCDQLIWVPLDHLPANTIPYIRRAVEKTQGDPGQIWFESFGW